jgi:hypothetical protein
MVYENSLLKHIVLKKRIDKPQRKKGKSTIVSDKTTVLSADQSTALPPVSNYVSAYKKAAEGVLTPIGQHRLEQRR